MCVSCDIIYYCTMVCIIVYKIKCTSLHVTTLFMYCTVYYAVASVPLRL